MVTTIKAIYENGVLKPLEPLDLQEKQVVLIHLRAGMAKQGEVVRLGGSWSMYMKNRSLSFEEIQALTHDRQMHSQERTLRHIEDGFDESGGADG